jgi:hypothetical protein
VYRAFPSTRYRDVHRRRAHITQETNRVGGGQNPNVPARTYSNLKTLKRTPSWRICFSNYSHFVIIEEAAVTCRVHVGNHNFKMRKADKVISKFRNIETSTWWWVPISISCSYYSTNKKCGFSIYKIAKWVLRSQRRRPTWRHVPTTPGRTGERNFGQNYVGDFSVKVRAGSAATATTYKMKVVKFGGGTPANIWIEVLNLPSKVWTQNSMTTVTDGKASVKMILREDALTTRSRLSMTTFLRDVTFSYLTHLIKTHRYNFPCFVRPPRPSGTLG